MKQPILPFTLNDLPNEEYHNGEDFKEFCSSSVLKKMQISPKFAKHCLDNPIELNTAATSQGSVYHSMLASIANHGNAETGFNKEYFVFAPPKNMTTGKSYGFASQAYQDALMCAKAEAGEREACSEGEKQIAESMIDELLNNNPHLSPQVRNLLKIGKAEQSHFLDYQGRKFKYRTDLKTANKIVDFKKVGDPVKTKRGACKPDKFDKEIIKFGYGISAAFYQFFEHEYSKRWKSFFWIAQESEPPFDFTILGADNYAYKISNEDGVQYVEPGTDAMILTKMIDQWCLCHDTKLWPGYSVFIQPDNWNKRIGFPNVPIYHQRQDYQFYN